MLYIIRGLPGSGKTTFAQHLKDAGLVENYWEADQYFTVNGEYRWDPRRLGEAHQQCFNKVKADLEAGRNTAVSNTFVKKSDYMKYVNLANSCHAGFFLLAMNGGYPNIHGVPADTLERMRRNWEA